MIEISDKISGFQQKFLGISPESVQDFYNCQTPRVRIIRDQLYTQYTVYSNCKDIIKSLLPHSKFKHYRSLCRAIFIFLH